MPGWRGQILKIDLTARTTSVEPLPDDLCRRYVGGRGLAGHFLAPRVTRKCDEPEMPLILMAGPLVGTALPMSGFCSMMSRSPLTGTVGDCALGGTVGTMIKRVGFDGVIISGCSEAPCGIAIRDNDVRFVDAADLWGRDSEFVHAHLEGAGAAVTIGPAAENGVRFANVIVDRRDAAGRNGLGLVMAAKRLKFITVSGTGDVPVHDPAALNRAQEEIARLMAASPILMGELGLTSYGTAAIYDLIDSRRMMPTANFRQTHFAAAASMNACSMHQAYRPTAVGCSGCAIRCRYVAADGRPMPEFETMSHFSALLENDDLETVMCANEICNQMGMDTISAGGTLACHAELAGRRLSSEEILSLLTDIGRGRGVGVELGQGSAAYAAMQGEPHAAVSVKGLELPAYDPRGACGMALSYATSTCGACHLRAFPIGHEILRKPVATDRFSFGGKARIIKIGEDVNAVADSLTACKLVFLNASLEEYATALTAVTGVESTAQDLLRIGERIYYHERLMNAQNGFSAADDDLPPRFFEAAGSSGAGITVKPIDREEFLAARARYYRVRGLDENGMPTREKAEELGLAWHE